MKLEERAKELWDELTAVLTGGCSFQEMRPVLLKIKEFYTDVDPILAFYVQTIIYKEDDARALEWDTIRELLHGEFDSAIKQMSSLRHSIRMRYGRVLKEHFNSKRK